MRSRMLGALLVVGLVALTGCKSNQSSGANGPNDANKVVAMPPAPPAPVVSPMPAGPGDMALKPVSEPMIPATTIGPSKTHMGASVKAEKPAKAVRVAKAHEHAGGKYIVKKGDNLSKIAKKVYGNSKKYKEIAMANNINNPNHIRVGQVLVIP